MLRPLPPLPPSVHFRPLDDQQRPGTTTENAEQWRRAVTAADALLQAAARYYAAASSGPSNRTSLAAQRLRGAAHAYVTTGQAHAVAMIGGYRFAPSDLDGLPSDDYRAELARVVTPAD